MPHSNDPILFEHFVKLLVSIAQIGPRSASAPRGTTKQHKSLELVNRWFTSLRQYYAVVPPRTCQIFFRLFFPEEDVRRRYNIKETVLADTLVTNVFCVSLDGGCPLLKWSEYLDAADKTKLGCLGFEVQKALESRHTARQRTSPTLQRVDELLDELASLSGYSDLKCKQSLPRRNRTMILRELFLDLVPVEAKFMTQIILKDLRPVLYPLSETHTTRALIDFKSNAVRTLTKWDVMKAWHPCMPRMYRARATFDETAQAIENISKAQIPPTSEMFSPVLGVPIEIPKSQKGLNLSHALNFFSHQDKIWCETKYDGERMQIHVDLSKPPSHQIAIFSKSKRNSTQDRRGTHAIIRAALGLTSSTEDYTLYPSLKNSFECFHKRRITSSVVLDAEMVPYSESKGDIDEFWRLRSLVESTADGIRGTRYRKCQNLVPQSLLCESQDNQIPRGEEFSVGSLQSNASDDGDRHLMVVFFDIMYLDGSNLLDRPYHERRAELEKVIHVIPGFTLLSQRHCISLSQGLPMATRELARVFSHHIATYQEGIILKGSMSRYNSIVSPWVKLKRDYIPGYGDTVDLIIVGASWNKARARELRVAPETLTTFFIAAIDKPNTGVDLTYCSPHFQTLFTVEYGLDREQLESLNFYIKGSEPQCFGYEMPNLPYKVNFPQHLVKPAILLSQPLLGELFGAGFSKDPGAKYYSLRFPRLTKVWRSSERNWSEGSSLADFQKVARLTIGRESSDEWASRNVEEMWGCQVTSGPKDPHIVATNERQWYEKLLQHERLAAEGTSGRSPIKNKASLTKRSAVSKDNPERIPKRRKTDVAPSKPQPLETLGSTTNILHALSQSSRRAAAATPSCSTSLIQQKRKIKRKLYETEQDKTSTVPDISLKMIFPESSALVQKLGNTHQTTFTDQLSTPSNPSIQLGSPETALLQANPQYISHPEGNGKTRLFIDVIPPAVPMHPSWPPKYRHTPLIQFIQDAYVWIHQETNNKRPADRPPALQLVPQNRRVKVIYFLLIICGCRVELGGKIYAATPHQFAHVSKCVMFVKTGDDSVIREGLEWLLSALETWRGELNKPGNKELLVFDSELLTYDSLAKFGGDVESKVLWKSGGII